jgi:hypothetical protein
LKKLIFWVLSAAVLLVPNQQAFAGEYDGYQSWEYVFSKLPPNGPEDGCNILLWGCTTVNTKQDQRAADSACVATYNAMTAPIVQPIPLWTNLSTHRGFKTIPTRALGNYHIWAHRDNGHCIINI